MEGREGCITDEIGAERQLQYICLVLTHVAFDFQCRVQKSFIMTQLLRDVCACVCVCVFVCVHVYSFVEVGGGWEVGWWGFIGEEENLSIFESDLWVIQVLHVVV